MGEGSIGISPGLQIEQLLCKVSFHRSLFSTLNPPALKSGRRVEKLTAGVLLSEDDRLLHWPIVQQLAQEQGTGGWKPG